MEDRDFRELQAHIERLEARLTEIEARPRARLSGLLGLVPSSRRARVTLVVAVLAVATASYAAQISIPYTFTNGTIADADEVNANFGALMTESNDQDLRLTTVEDDLAVHEEDPSAHHVKTTSFADLTDSAEDSQIPDDITIEYALDADTLDGQHASAFATESALNDHKANEAAHHTRYTDPEAVGAILANDGPGSGLNADLLDGFHSASFSLSGHNHDDLYYTEAEVNGLVNGLQTQIDQLNNLLAGVTRDVDDLGYDRLLFEGMNVQIGNGSKSTSNISAPDYDGRGNLIVGYNENVLSRERTGSHNLIVGMDHAYTSYAGLVAGSRNTVSGANASVSGGYDNKASGVNSSVSGGEWNTASGAYCSVSGGDHNKAEYMNSSVSGGAFNTAYLNRSSVSGGTYNTASGTDSSVSGGDHNEASDWQSSVSGGYYNTASGDYASISGGFGNFTSGEYSQISGGGSNTASGDASSVLGGSFNQAGGDYSTIGGGSSNTASVGGSSVSGGSSNTANGTNSSVSGGSSNVASGTNSSVSGGWNNRAIGSASSVSGGESNSASVNQSVAASGYGVNVRERDGLQLQVHDALQASGSDANPEVYELTSPYHTCNADSRGMVYVTRPSGAGGNQDSLCYCGYVTDGYKTHCFNP